MHRLDEIHTTLKLAPLSCRIDFKPTLIFCKLITDWFVQFANHSNAETRLLRDIISDELTTLRAFWKNEFCSYLQLICEIWTLVWNRSDNLVGLILMSWSSLPETVLDNNVMLMHVFWSKLCPDRGKKKD